MSARTVPTGWKCSDRLKLRVDRILPKFEDILCAETKRFGCVPGVDADGLLQEARILATYAIDTWNEKRGKKLRGWIGLVVRHGLGAVVNHEKALKRAPRELTPGKKRKWANRRDSRLAEFSASDTIEQTAVAPSRLTLHEQIESSGIVQRVLDGLSARDKAVLLVRLSPPPELVLAARNTRPKRRAITDQLVADYLGISVARVKRSLANAKAVWREVDASA